MACLRHVLSAAFTQLAITKHWLGFPESTTGNVLIRVCKVLHYSSGIFWLIAKAWPMNC